MTAAASLKHETHTPFDLFNEDIDHQQFPDKGMSPRAAEAIVNSETWTDANPMLNLSSFVTTFMEHEANEIMRRHSTSNFADPDMYPRTKAAEFHCIRWLHDLWTVRKTPGRTAPRPPDPLKPACLPGSLTNGTGARRSHFMLPGLTVFTSFSSAFSFSSCTRANAARASAARPAFCSTRPS